MTNSEDYWHRIVPGMALCGSEIPAGGELQLFNAGSEACDDEYLAASQRIGRGQSTRRADDKVAGRQKLVHLAGEADDLCAGRQITALFWRSTVDQKIVRRLESELEEAIADVIVHRLRLKHLPLLPSRRTMHLMAKAAVAVYETAVEAHGDAERE